MAIYDIFEQQQTAHAAPPQPEPETRQEPLRTPDRLFTRIAARLFFILLLIADLLWASYSLLLLLFTSLATLLTAGRVAPMRKYALKFWISTRRSLVCGLSLILALFSPAFGIMVACTYFLMYDKAGLDEVVPSSIQSQFKDMFKR